MKSGKMTSKPDDTHRKSLNHRVVKAMIQLDMNMLDIQEWT